MNPNDSLREIRAELDRKNKEIQALVKSAAAILTLQGFTDVARAIFDFCRELTGAQSGYVALLSETGEENEVLFLESGGLPCTVDPELPMPIRGLRAESYRLSKAVYENDFMKSAWIRFMPKGHVALKNVLFAPLVLDGKTVGLIGLANKAGDFTDRDAETASHFGTLAAIALRNSRDADARAAAEKQKEALIVELSGALENVKKLSGLLPICSFCNKIRDDKGYWKQLEAYIHQHSEARFSHGLCPECAKKHYPEYDLD